MKVFIKREPNFKSPRFWEEKQERANSCCSDKVMKMGNESVDVQAEECPWYNVAVIKL